jgi:hypothetical protein
MLLQWWQVAWMLLQHRVAQMLLWQSHMALELLQLPQWLDPSRRVWDPTTMARSVEKGGDHNDLQ